MTHAFCDPLLVFQHLRELVARGRGVNFIEIELNNLLENWRCNILTLHFDRTFILTKIKVMTLSVLFVYLY